LQPGDRAQAFLLDGRIVAPGVDLAARGERDPRSVVPKPGVPRVPLLAVLSSSDFFGLAGKPVRFSGRFNVDVQRVRVIASAPLADGTVVSADGARLTIDDVFAANSDVPQRVAQGVTVETYVPAQKRARRLEYRLRDTRSGCQTRWLIPSSPSTEAASFALLPTLARPFAVRAGNLVALDSGGCRPLPADSVVEMVESLNLLRTIDVTLDFTMPTVADGKQAPADLPAMPRER